MRVVIAGTVTTMGGEDAHGIETFNRQGNIDIRVDGAVRTSGARAAAVRASIDDSGPATPVMGRSAVTVAAGGAVETTGAEAPGIELYAESATDIEARVTVDGAVRTSGAGSAALRARVGDDDPSTTVPIRGNIALTVSGRGALEASGVDAPGLYASTEAGDIDLTVSAAVRSAGTGAAVREEAPLDEGRLALTVAAGGLVAGATAVAFDGGSTDPDNPNRLEILAGGRVRGALALGDGADLVDNRGVLSLLRSSQFGAGTDRFAQAGRLEPGGAGRIEAVSVWGAEVVDFAASSVLAIEVDGMSGRADRVDFGAEAPGDPGAVSLGGVVEVRELPVRSGFRRGERSHVVLTADRALQGGDALGLRAPVFPADQVIQRRYRLERAEREIRLVERTVGSFVVADASRNVRAVGAELDRLALGVAPRDLPAAFETLLSGLGELRSAAYARAVDGLHAEPYDALLQGSWQAERSLVEGLWAGCRPGEERGICVFGGLWGRSLDRVGSRESSGFEEVAVGPRGGVSGRVGDFAGRSWELRLGASYEALDLAWRAGGGGRGDRLLGGLVLHSRAEEGAAGGSGGAAWRGWSGLDAGLALAGGRGLVRDRAGGRPAGDRGGGGGAGDDLFGRARSVGVPRRGGSAGAGLVRGGGARGQRGGAVAGVVYGGGGHGRRAAVGGGGGGGVVHLGTTASFGGRELDVGGAALDAPRPNRCELRGGGRGHGVPGALAGGAWGGRLHDPGR